MRTKQFLSDLFKLAWQFVKKERLYILRSIKNRLGKREAIKGNAGVHLQVLLSKSRWQPS
jgi:hypothetical protein